MKTKILLIATAFFMALNLQAQAPEKFNYQGIARDNTGAPLANQALGIKISILHNTTVDYSETHSVTTNDFGLYTLMIGDGTPVFGGMASVDWDSGNKFVKVEIDPAGGTNYTDLGTTELLSVPYALYALETGSSGGSSPTGAAGGDLSGNYPNPDIANNAITSNKIANGAVKTVDLENAAVTAPKIADMGATSGQVLKYDGTNWAPANDDAGTAGWGLSGNTATTTDFIGTTNAEPLRFKVNNEIAGEVSNSSSTSLGYQTLNVSTGVGNSAFGHKTLKANTTGQSNSAFGSSSLGLNTTGDKNSAFGEQTLGSNTIGSFNVAIGENSLRFNTSGDKNSAIGRNSLFSNTTGKQNVAIGHDALNSSLTTDNSVAIGYNALKANLSAGETAVGAFALTSSTTGSSNTAVGYNSLFSNTTGDNNTAVGSSTLDGNTTGSNNTAVGNNALILNSTGEKNSAFGSGSMLFSSTGSENSSFGYNTMAVSTTGSQNAAFGSQAMLSNLQGNGGAAFGYKALYSNTTGDYNAGFGFEVLNGNTTGDNNVAMGYQALQDNTIKDGNTAIGYKSMQMYSSSTGTGAYGGNTAIGSNAEVSDGILGAMALGELSTVTTSDHIVVGSIYTAQIGGYASWTNLSDIRFKKDVQPQEHGLDFIMKLEPITYHVDAQKLFEFQNSVRENKIEQTPQMAERMHKKASELQSGFSAQQVEVAAQAVGYDFSGVNAPENNNSHYTLEYASFVVPLVKAIQEQQATIEKMQQTIAAMQAQLEAMEQK